MCCTVVDDPSEQAASVPILTLPSLGNLAAALFDVLGEYLLVATRCKFVKDLVGDFLETLLHRFLCVVVVVAEMQFRIQSIKLCDGVFVWRNTTFDSSQTFSEDIPEEIGLGAPDAEKLGFTLLRLPFRWRRGGSFLGSLGNAWMCELVVTGGKVVVVHCWFDVSVFVFDLFAQSMS